MTKIIVDACCNHLGNPYIIEEMIKQAGKLGADYIKFQLYDADMLNQEYKEHDDKYKDFLALCELDGGDVDLVVDLCSHYKIMPMFTIFHPDELQKLDGNDKCPLKIASCDANKTWVYDVVKSAYPAMTVISLGMSTEDEKKKLLKKYENDKNVKFLSCVSMYPCRSKDIDWGEAKLLNGLSCHTDEDTVLKRALDSDLEFLEVHFTLSHLLPGKDHKFSVDLVGLHHLINYRGYLQNVKRYKERFVIKNK